MAADIPEKQAFMDVIIEMVMVLEYRNGCKHSLNMRFLSMQVLRGEGHEDRGMAANIPLKRACKDAVIERGRA